MTTPRCRVCGSDKLALAKQSTVAALSSTNFAITDSSYGQTLAIYRCAQCGFMQCHDVDQVLAFYQVLSDEAYEAGRAERMVQASAIIHMAKSQIARTGGQPRLLDVGAGSGILVEAAGRAGLSAEGVEPSNWLASTAHKHGCRVYQGVLPHPSIQGPYDIITIIDVIEHVDDPGALLRQARSLLRQDGILVVVTPDTGSFAARMMGWRWWHYRVAHIGYFNRQNLTLLCEREDLNVRAWSRPGWFFTVAYLRERLRQYLPWWLLPKMKWMERAVVPLNLRDSLLFVCSQRRSESRDMA